MMKRFSQLTLKAVSSGGCGGSCSRVSRRCSYATESSASPQELAHFAELAKSWWDVDGPQRILHKMNLLRVDYIRETLCRYPKNYSPPGYSLDLLPESERQKYSKEQTADSNMMALDIGCGGGILAESLARTNMVGHVTAIDLSEEVLEAARLHSKNDPLLSNKLDYQRQGIEDVHDKFDMITMFEMLEHVPNPSEVLEKAIGLLNPGGYLFLSTINRTPASWFTTIFMGEQVLKIVPPGTHTWSKYINEQELRDWIRDHKEIEFVRSDGCLYVPGSGWRLINSQSIGNYFMVLRRRELKLTI